MAAARRAGYSSNLYDSGDEDYNAPYLYTPEDRRDSVDFEPYNYDYDYDLPSPSYDVYEVPTPRENVPFYGETTNRAHYVWKDPVSNPRVRNDRETMPDTTRVPFYGDTTHRSTFLPMEPLPRAPKNVPNESAPKVKFHGESTYRSIYTPHAGTERRTLTTRPCPAEKILKRTTGQLHNVNGHWYPNHRKH